MCEAEPKVTQFYLQLKILCQKWLRETAEEGLQGTSLPTVDHMGTLQCDVWDRAASEDQHKLSQQQVRLTILVAND